jgi:hypothetical protein
MISIKKTILIALLLLPVSIAAQPTFSGFLELDKRFVTGGDSTVIDDFYNRFRLEMQAPIGSKLYMFSSLDLRFYDFPRPQSLDDLEQIEQEFPLDLTLWEGFIDVYGFLFDNLDIRVGKQRINWGTADRLNPTDNLNPNDFSDILNFTEMIPSWAFKGTWYAGDLRLTGVWLPSVSPILLPRNGASLFVGEGGQFQNKLSMPEQTAKNSMFAFRLSGNIDRWDYSLSYFNGYDDVPIAGRVVVNPSLSTTPELQMEFPKMQVIGADLVTDLSGFGLWAEAGVFWPEEVPLTTVANGIETRQEQLKDTPYVKFTVGGDYTLSNGLYLNTQWMHGFFTERGVGNLNDYFILELEKDYFDEDLLVTLGNSLEVNDWKALGYGLSPELTYQAIDNFEAGAGAFWVWGEEGTLFNSWKQLDQVFVRFRVDF